MTLKRKDEHSTEFGLWLREQSEIDSKKGWAATNIDYMWTCWKTGKWMLLEEKRRGCKVSWSQQKLYDKVNLACKSDKNYMGFHILTFENTSPADGKIFWNGNEISKEQLIKTLQLGYEVPA